MFSRIVNKTCPAVSLPSLRSVSRPPRSAVRTSAGISLSALQYRSRATVSMVSYIVDMGNLSKLRRRETSELDWSHSELHFRVPGLQIDVFQPLGVRLRVIQAVMGAAAFGPDACTVRHHFAD